MIDTSSMIFSLGMVIYVIWRAVLLDRQLPWFGFERKSGHRRAPSRR